MLSMLAASLRQIGARQQALMHAYGAFDLASTTK